MRYNIIDKMDQYEETTSFQSEEFSSTMSMNAPVVPSKMTKSYSTGSELKAVEKFSQSKKQNSLKFSRFFDQKTRGRLTSQQIQLDLVKEGLESVSESETKNSFLISAQVVDGEDRYTPVSIDGIEPAKAVDILEEPVLQEMVKMKDEIEKIQKMQLKPEDVFLSYCKSFSENHLGSVDIDKEKIKINWDKHLKCEHCVPSLSKSIFTPDVLELSHFEVELDDVLPWKEKNRHLFFQTALVNGRAFMLLKSWTMMEFHNTDLEESLLLDTYSEFGDHNLNLNKRPESLGLTLTQFMKSEVKEKKLVSMKSADEVAKLKHQKVMFLKTIQIMDIGQIYKEIIVEQVSYTCFSCEGKHEGVFDEFSFETSILEHKNEIYYFKRIREEGKHRLQLYKCNLKSIEEREVLMNECAVVIEEEEMHLKHTSATHSKHQLNTIFSIEVRKGLENPSESEEEFLNRQFVAVQPYYLGSSPSSRQTSPCEVRIFSLKDLSKPITHSFEEIHMMSELRLFYSVSDKEKDQVTFMLADYKQVNEIKFDLSTLKLSDGPNNLVHHNHVTKYKQLRVPQVVREELIKVPQNTGKEEVQKVYFSIDDEGEVVLIYPLPFRRFDQLSIVEAIRNHEGLDKPTQDKTVRILSSNKKQACLDLKYLLGILNYDIPKNQQLSFVYQEDQVTQYLAIIDTQKGAKLPLKVFYLKNHIFKGCLHPTKEELRNTLFLSQMDSYILDEINELFLINVKRKNSISKEERHAINSPLKLIKKNSDQHDLLGLKYERKFSTKQIRNQDLKSIATLQKSRMTTKFQQAGGQSDAKMLCRRQFLPSVLDLKTKDTFNENNFFLSYQDRSKFSIKINYGVKDIRVVDERVLNPINGSKSQLVEKLSLKVDWYMIRKYTYFFFAQLTLKTKTEKKKAIFFIECKDDEIEEICVDSIFSSSKFLFELSSEISVFTGIESCTSSTLEELINNLKGQSDSLKMPEMRVRYAISHDDRVPLNFVPLVMMQKEGKKCKIFFQAFNIVKKIFATPCQVQMRTETEEMTFKHTSGFNHLMFCQTSSLEPENDHFSRTKPTETEPQKIKYSMFAFFKEDIGFIQAWDFLVDWKPQELDVGMVGMKQIILSSGFINDCKHSFMASHSLAVPYFNQDDRVEGCQLVLFKGRKANKTVLINLLDQSSNNIFQKRSEILMVGKIKQNLSKRVEKTQTVLKGMQRRLSALTVKVENNTDDGSQFALIFATHLRSKLIKQKKFKQQEVTFLLDRSLSKLASSKVPDLRSLVLRTFEDHCKIDFFMQLDLLDGKSLNDICLTDHFAVHKALNSKNCLEELQCMCTSIDYITEHNIFRKKMLAKVGLRQKRLCLCHDFNFQGTIQRAIESNASVQAMVLLDFIFQKNSITSYNELIMMDLQKILETDKITPEALSKFFHIRSQNQVHTNRTTKCSFENPLLDQDLPIYSSQGESFEFITGKSIFFDSLSKEVSQLIKDRDQKQKDTVKAQGQNSSIKVDHSFINFLVFNISLKINGEKRNSEISQIYLARMLKQLSSKQALYDCDTIRTLIDLQWKTGSMVNNFFFGLYSFFFVIPFSFDVINDKQLVLGDPWVNSCFCSQIVFLVIELMTMKIRGWQYFQDGWNIIDLAQILVFALNVCYCQVNSHKQTELLLLTVLLTSLKFLNFMRSSKQFGFLIRMIYLCLIGLIPFITCFLFFLGLFTVCFTVLKMEIDDEVDAAKGIGYFQKTFLQAFRTSIGELGLPKYNLILAKPPSWQKDVNIFLIWFLWYFQTFMMLVVMLNFLIAVITQTYKEVQDQAKQIYYAMKADINLKWLELMYILGRANEEFTIILLSKQAQEEEEMDQQNAIQTQEVKQFIIRCTTLVRDEMNAKLAKMDKRQTEFEQKVLNMLASAKKENDTNSKID